MDRKQDIREFLVTRRARVTPDQVGIPTFGGERRVPGLRREEVATLAGVSVDYYTRLERGNLSGASESVLDSIARALLLDDDERAHLFNLAQARPARVRRNRQAPRQIRTSVQRMLDSLDAPSVVFNTRQDLVAANAMGRVLYSQLFDAAEANMARFIFLDPRAQDFYVDWGLARKVTAAMLRMEAGRNPLDGDLTALIGELSARSLAFRRDWARQDVHVHEHGTKQFRHPDVGMIEMAYDVLEMPGDTGLSIVAYTVEAGTPSADALALLAALNATSEAQRPGRQTSTRTAN